MKNTNSLDKWLSVGYDLFAEEGPEGIQIERLARILQLNKSGFYHYFGNLDSFFEALMKRHLGNGLQLSDEMKKVKQFDPEFINVLVIFEVPVMVHYQLIRNKHLPLLLDTYNRVNELVDPVTIRLFAEFIGFKDHEEFAAKYYEQVRDMFYTQISRERLKYPFLRDFLYKAREVILNAVSLTASR